MKAVVNGVHVEGTPEEIAQYQKLIKDNKSPIYTSIGSGCPSTIDRMLTIEGGSYGNRS